MLKRKREKVYLCVWLVCMILCACSQDTGEVILIGSEVSEAQVADASTVIGKNRRKDTGTPDAEAYTQEMIRVYVCGAVTNPGVVEIHAGSRVEDALEAAGGFALNADRTYVNLADWLEDGQMLYFPTEEEEDEGLLQISRGQSQAMGMTGLVNINTADMALLCTLPGIGESRAADIIAYREAHGMFESCEDIMSVPGIKTGVFEKICDKITVD